MLWQQLFVRIIVRKWEQFAWKVFKKPQEDFTKVGKIIKFKTTVEEKDLKTKIIKTIKNNEVNCNTRRS